MHRELVLFEFYFFKWKMNMVSGLPFEFSDVSNFGFQAQDYPMILRWSRNSRVSPHLLFPDEWRKKQRNDSDGPEV